MQSYAYSCRNLATSSNGRMARKSELHKREAQWEKDSASTGIYIQVFQAASFPSLPALLCTNVYSQSNRKAMIKTRMALQKPSLSAPKLTRPKRFDPKRLATRLSVAIAPWQQMFGHLSHVKTRLKIIGQF